MNNKNLKMKTLGIIVAMAKEIAYLNKIIKTPKTQKIGNITFYQGIYQNMQIVYATSGIGKVNASIATILLIENFQPALIINTGIAGGYARSLKPLDLIVATKVLYDDVDMTAPAAGNYKMGQIEGLPPYFLPKVELIKDLNDFQTGTILTGDQFVYDYQKCQQLVEKNFSNYDVIAFDMESGAVAQVCTLNQIPFIIIRAISDIIGTTNVFDYNQFAELAANKVMEEVLNIIKNF